MMRLILFALLVVLSITNQQSESLELRYKVCTVEELRHCLQQFCMRLGEREGTNSVQMLSPFGSVSNSQEVNYEVSAIDFQAHVDEILKASRPLSSRIRTHSVYMKRELSGDRAPSVDSCCQESCVIDPEDLASHCVSL